MLVRDILRILEAREARNFYIETPKTRRRDLQ
jgi:hypothetical protein